jgi:hypothetical protein
MANNAKTTEAPPNVVATQGKQYVIPESLAQAVLEYLSTRPYREVAHLVGGLLSLQPVPEATGGEPND